MSWSEVERWLEGLGLDGYCQSFVDNGYDELELCRQIGLADLDAIGVSTATDRARILQAVNQLQASSLPDPVNRS